MTPLAAASPGRRRGLMLALAVTLGATAWFALQDEEAGPSTAAASIGARSAATETSVPLKAATPASATWPEPPSLKRPRWAALAPTAGSAWAPPPPPPPPVQSKRPSTTGALLVGPMPLKAPAFPYTLIGRLDDGQAHALLSGPLRSFGVKVADVIDGQWRVDEVQARGITLTWLPGGVKTTLVFASL